MFLRPVLSAAALVAWFSAAGADPSPPPSLREAASGLFPIGVGISDRIPERPADWPLLTAQFAAVTPENCLKPNPVQVAEGRFRFVQADAFVGFAVSNRLQVVGHCLVWAKDDRTPPWFFRDGTNAAGRELLLARMKAHIDTVAGRYRGRIAMWDVVNEALDDGTNYLRPSGWSAACGEEFIAKAFDLAHAADPGALLVYNDYNNELPGKREKQIRLARSLLDRRVPLHAIGLQGHYELDRIPFRDIEDTLIAVRGLGLKVVVSELDIDVIPRGRWWADGGRHREELAKLDPYREGCPPEILRRQADQYAQLFRLFRKHADVIARVSFWNLHDGQSWLNQFPWPRANHPLLFDREGKPKPAFAAVISALGKETAAATEAGPPSLRLSALRNPVWASQDNLRDPSVLKTPEGYHLFYSRLSSATGGWGDPKNWAIACAFTKDFVRFEHDRDVSPKGFASPGDVVRWHGRWVLPFQSYPAAPVRLCFSESKDLRDWSAPKFFLEDAALLPWNGQRRVIDPSLVVEGDTLHCFFVGSAVRQDAGGKGVRANLMGHALTRDPSLQRWEILSRDAPLIGGSESAPDGVENTMIFRTGGHWTMIYSEGLARQHLALATSKDLRTWDLQGPLDIPRQQWTLRKFGAPFVWREEAQWLMILMGTNDRDRTTFGLLTSPDGTKWTPLPE